MLERGLVQVLYHRWEKLIICSFRRLRLYELCVASSCLNKLQKNLRRNFSLFSDAELDNFVGQESVNSHNSTSPVILTDTDTAFTHIPLHSEGTKSKSADNQSVKQGYLTSILSSLPNLTLSSITSDLTETQASQGLENVSGVQNTNPLYVPSHDSRDSLGDTPPPVVPNFHEPRRSNLVGASEVYTGNTVNLAPQPTLPPTIPSSTDGKFSSFFSIYKTVYKRKLYALIINMRNIFRIGFNLIFLQVWCVDRGIRIWDFQRFLIVQLLIHLLYCNLFTLNCQLYLKYTCFVVTM